MRCVPYTHTYLLFSSFPHFFLLGACYHTQLWCACLCVCMCVHAGVCVSVRVLARVRMF